jgi:hypothetical protein
MGLDIANVTVQGIVDSLPPWTGSPSALSASALVAAIALAYLVFVSRPGLKKKPSLLNLRTGGIPMEKVGEKYDDYDNSYGMRQCLTLGHALVMQLLNSSHLKPLLSSSLRP